jgi:hypothetical protein
MGTETPRVKLMRELFFYQWAVSLSEGEMAFGGELETMVTLSPLPHLLGLLDSASPYPNLSSLGHDCFKTFFTMYYRSP